MKITIDISEFYLDPEEGENIEKELKQFIIREAVHSINTQIEKKVREQITSKVNEAINSKLSEVINREIEKCVVSENIIVSGKEVSIADHIKEYFQNSHGWNNAYDVMKKLASNFGDELKKRYDTLFATQVVVKMKELDYLKDGVAKALIEEKK